MVLTMTKKTTYKEDLTIDPLNLDEELKWQPSLFMKWSELYAEASHTYDRKKEALEVLYAQLYESVAISPESYDIDRVTETSIKSAVVQMPSYRRAIKGLYEAKKKMTILASAKDAMRHKKDTLENLVRLFLSGYFSDPKVPRKAKEAFSTIQDKGISKQLSRSKRIKKLRKAKKKNE
jgi:hypothetical protein